MKPKIFVDLTYFVFDVKSTEAILKSCRGTLGYLAKMDAEFKVYFLLRTTLFFEKVEYYRLSVIFYQSKTANLWQIPFKYNSFINFLKADYILVHGFGYAHHLIFLKIIIPKAKIVLQCNGYAAAPTGIKKMIYKFANYFIDGYLFTGIENAKQWYELNIFQKGKVHQVMEGSTDFKFDPTSDRTANSFLWVGRLDDNKDPLTILEAFNQFLDGQPLAKLTMIFHEDNLLAHVKSVIAKSTKLSTAVCIKGFVEHKLLEEIYNKNQYFILGSHFEGSGYALAEAMACGCVPIVTNIPSFRYMTNDGECALLFSPGNVDEILIQLQKTSSIDYNKYQNKGLEQFDKKLSFAAIARDIKDVFQSL